MANFAPTTTSVVAAAPTMTSMVAAAPAMTSMYASPASVFMPAAAAPTTTAVAAPVAATTAFAAPVAATTFAPSFVAAPAQAFAMPAPASLTAGLPDPATLKKEQDAYEKALNAQLEKQSNAVNEEAKIKKAMLEQTAKTQLEQYKLQIEENLKMSCLQVDREAQTTVSGLREAAIMQQTAQEERAAVMIADYNKKKAMEDMAAESAKLQQQWYDGEARLMAQYNAVMQKGSNSVLTPAMPQVPMGMIP